jgi:Glycosyltransferase family 87
VQGRTIWLVIGALVALRVLVTGGLLLTTATEPEANLPGDVWRYHEIAKNHGTPYRDFDVEYPPVTLAAIEVLDLDGIRSTTISLMWSQLALDLVIALTLGWAWGRRAALAYLLVGVPFVLFPFLYLRLDLLSVALAVGGLALVRRGYAGTGGALLTVACFAKIWPLVVAPVLLVRRAWRSLVAFVAVGAAGLAAWIAWGGTDAPVQVLTFRGAHGWEIESIAGALLREARDLPVRLVKGAYRVGGGPAPVSWALLAIGIGAVVWVWMLAARVPRGDDRALDGLAPIAAITATLATATIISPQYLSWLLPFAAIALAHDERAVASLVAIASGLSVLEFARIDELVRGDSFPIAIVLLRNGVLVGLFVVCAVRLNALREQRCEGALSRAA